MKYFKRQKKDGEGVLHNIQKDACLIGQVEPRRKEWGSPQLENLEQLRDDPLGMPVADYIDCSIGVGGPVQGS